MAVVEVRRVVPVEVGGAPADGEGAVVAAEAVAVDAGNSGKPLTRPEAGYLILIVAALAVGAILGIWIDDGKRMYTPPDGVSIFALFYIAAQAIERLLEPLANFYGTTKATADDDGGKPASATKARYTKSQAVKERDKALATPDAAVAAAEAAWWQEMIEQIRRNTATLWAIASMLGMIVAGWLGLLLLHAVQAPHAPRWFDIIVTGIVVGGGTKPLHDLIENVQKSKEKKENPSGVSGQSAS
jgi:hypothetical protein